MKRHLIDWRYNNKLKDKGYFFKTIKENSPEEISNINNEPKYSYNESESFNDNLISTLNNINKIYDNERIHRKM